MACSVVDCATLEPAPESGKISRASAWAAKANEAGAKLELPYWG